MIYLFTILTFVLAVVTKPLFLNLLLESQLIQNNYKREVIPTGMGLYLFFNLATSWSLGYLSGIYTLQSFVLLLMLSGFFAFLGFIDDILGDKKERGFIGHFGSLINGKLTTGGLKALGAAVISLVVVYYISDTVTETFISWLTLLFVTNFINLLDLRPGRALKMFTAGLLFLFVFTWQLDIWYLAIPILATLTFYFPMDISAEAMMGDTGANLLGGVLGYFIIQTVGVLGEGVILFSIALVNLYSERNSLSAYIEKNRVLDFFDKMGRDDI